MFKNNDFPAFLSLCDLEDIIYYLCHDGQLFFSHVKLLNCLRQYWHFGTEQCYILINLSLVSQKVKKRHKHTFCLPIPSFPLKNIPDLRERSKAHLSERPTTCTAEGGSLYVTDNTMKHEMRHSIRVKCPGIRSKLLSSSGIWY